MGYYEDLRDAVHDQLQKIYKEKKSYEKVFHDLNVTSQETIRKIAGKEYQSWNYDLQTLEELKGKLGIQIPDRSYRMNMPSEAKKDLNSVADYFIRFDEYQRNAILNFCELMDSVKRYYQKGTSVIPYPIPAVADDAAIYDSSGSHPGRMSQSSDLNSRKTD